MGVPEFLAVNDVVNQKSRFAVLLLNFMLGTAMILAASRDGAAEALRLAELFSCDAAILKERSPACGSGRIYDGSFSKTLISGDGVAAACLKAHGVPVLGESQLGRLEEGEA